MRNWSPNASSIRGEGERRVRRVGAHWRGAEVVTLVSRSSRAFEVTFCVPADWIGRDSCDVFATF